jgi:nitrile hydratase
MASEHSHPTHPHAAHAGHDSHGAHDGHDHAHLDEMDLRVRALETLLTEKGYVDPAAIDQLIETYEVHVGPHNGARVVARAWADPAFADWLARDATAAIASLGYTGRQGEHMVAVFNTPAQHHMVVCTLCSCYPWPVLGLPPVWYKSAAYRSRAVAAPRAVLADFGVVLPDSTAIRVWDSTAEVRYLVVPMRPAGTEGFGEGQLAALVTRDAMIGTGLALAPAASAATP